MAKYERQEGTAETGKKKGQRKEKMNKRKGLKMEGDEMGKYERGGNG